MVVLVISERTSRRILVKMHQLLVSVLLLTTISCKMHQLLVSVLLLTTISCSGSERLGLTTFGEDCLDACKQRGFPFAWCHKPKSRNGTFIDRDYCSPVVGTTRYLEPCLDACDRREGKPFYWCHTHPTSRGDWDYCSPFPEDSCSWGSWGSWGRCSVSCGHGSKTRRRRIEGSNGRVGRCSGETEVVFQACHEAECLGPVDADCEWSEWSGWSLCSISCGTGGERRRYRLVRREARHGGQCQGETSQIQPCPVYDCPNWTLPDLPVTTVLPGEGLRIYLGDLQDTQHGVAGRVFGIPPDTLLIRDFSFDGLLSDTHVWVGNADDPESGGQVLLEKAGAGGPLKAMTRTDLLFSLPRGLKVQDIRWLSVKSASALKPFGRISIAESSLADPGSLVETTSSFAAAESATESSISRTTSKSSGGGVLGDVRDVDADDVIKNSIDGGSEVILSLPTLSSSSSSSFLSPKGPGQAKQQGPASGLGHQQGPAAGQGHQLGPAASQGHQLGPAASQSHQSGPTGSQQSGTTPTQGQQPGPTDRPEPGPGGRPETPRSSSELPPASEPEVITVDLPDLSRLPEQPRSLGGGKHLFQFGNNFMIDKTEPEDKKPKEIIKDRTQDKLQDRPQDKRPQDSRPQDKSQSKPEDKHQDTRPQDRTPTTGQQMKEGKQEKGGKKEGGEETSRKVETGSKTKPDVKMSDGKEEKEGLFTVTRVESSRSMSNSTQVSPVVVAATRTPLILTGGSTERDGFIISRVVEEVVLDSLDSAVGLRATTILPQPTSATTATQQQLGAKAEPSASSTSTEETRKDTQAGFSTARPASEIAEATKLSSMEITTSGPRPVTGVLNGAETTGLPSVGVETTPVVVADSTGVSMPAEAVEAAATTTFTPVVSIDTVEAARSSATATTTSGGVNSIAAETGTAAAITPAAVLTPAAAAISPEAGLTPAAAITPAAAVTPAAATPGTADPNTAVPIPGGNGSTDSTPFPPFKTRPNLFRPASERPRIALFTRPPSTASAEDGSTETLPSRPTFAFATSAKPRRFSIGTTTEASGVSEAGGVAHHGPSTGGGGPAGPSGPATATALAADGQEAAGGNSTPRSRLLDTTVFFTSTAGSTSAAGSTTAAAAIANVSADPPELTTVAARLPPLRTTPSTSGVSNFRLLLDGITPPPGVRQTTIISIEPTAGSISTTASATEGEVSPSTTDNEDDLATVQTTTPSTSSSSSTRRGSVLFPRRPSPLTGVTAAIRPALGLPRSTTLSTPLTNAVANIRKLQDIFSRRRSTTPSSSPKGDGDNSKDDSSVVDEEHSNELAGQAEAQLSGSGPSGPSVTEPTDPLSGTERPQRPSLFGREFPPRLRPAQPFTRRPIPAITTSDSAATAERSGAAHSATLPTLTSPRSAAPEVSPFTTPRLNGLRSGPADRAHQLLSRRSSPAPAVLAGTSADQPADQSAVTASPDPVIAVATLPVTTPRASDEKARMSDDTRFKILTDFMMKSMDEEEEEENLLETDRASGGKINKKVNAVENLNDKEFEAVDKIKSVHELTTKWESDKELTHSSPSPPVKPTDPTVPISIEDIEGEEEETPDKSTDSDRSYKPCDIRGACGPNAKCSAVGTTASCSCPDGFSGIPRNGLPDPQHGCVRTPRSCAGNSTCPGSYSCVREACLQQCTGDTQCALGERCISATDKDPVKVCIKICFYDAHCLAGEFCEENVCRPGCHSDSNCPFGQICGEGECKDGCNFNNDCPINQECRLGKCSDPCIGFRECGTNAVCTPVEHLPTCTCPPGYKELNSPYDACVEENVDLTQLECLTDSDCSAPSTCIRGVCTPSGAS